MLKLMNLFLVLLFAFQSFAFGSPSGGHDKSLANINEGNLAVMASFSLSHSIPSGSSSRTSLYLTGSPQYFFFDRLSLGITTGVYHTFGDDDLTSWSLGPAFTYHFWQDEKIVANVGMALEHNSYDVIFYNSNIGYGRDTRSYFSVQPSIGLNYFITPAVAVGPAIQYRHSFSNDSLTSSNNVSLLGAFSIYL